MATSTWAGTGPEIRTRAALDAALAVALLLAAVVVWSLLQPDRVGRAWILLAMVGAAAIVAGTGWAETAARRRGSVPGEVGNAARLLALVAGLLAVPALLVQLVPSERVASDAFAPRACPGAEVPPAGFSDTAGHAFEQPVACAAWWRLAGGVGDGRFAPDAPVTASQLAAMLSGVAEAAGSATPPAPDALPAAGLVARADLAAALVATYEDTTGERLAPGLDRFRDDEDHPRESAVNAAAAAGLVSGTSRRTYDPDRAVTRGQAAVALVRLLDRLVEKGVAATPG